MHYFPGWTEDFILTMPWVKFMLYMASIPSYKDDKEEKEKPQVKDSDDIF